MGTFRRWIWPAAVLAALAPGGCGDGGGDSPPANNVPQVSLTFERVFPNLTFGAPVAMLQAPSDGTRWFVVEQGGRVRTFQNNAGVTSASTFIDISARVTFRGELGLLGMAFHPQFPSPDPRVFLFYSNTTNGVLASRLSSFQTTDGGLTLNPNSEQILLTINKPVVGTAQENHNGGNLAFGPIDGSLYLGIGDGGGANDQHGTIGNGQLTTTLHGKMLRISIPTFPGTGYGIPGSNPNANNANTPCGANGSGSLACPEIFAIGFRNPWRWSFDRSNGDLWVGDVGQGALEEIDKVVLGGNFGWRCFEGTQRTPFGCGTPGTTILPVAQYGRSVGQSVTGGFVYRGTRFPGLSGRYIFGDFVSGRIFSIDSAAQGPLTLGDGFSSGLGISSFGQDVDGELYIVDYGDGQPGTGRLFRIRQ
jgi:glucose/arabinose dehydrogenase